MSGFLDFLTTGSPQTTNSGTSGSSTLPSWYMNYLQPALNNAATVASQPFPNYGATGMPRIADFTDMQKQAQGQVQQTQTNGADYQPYMNAATQATTNAATPYNSSSLNQYLSPYLNGVTGAIQQQGMNMWNEQLMPGIQDAFVGAGQQGSTREGTVLDQGARDVTQGVLSQSALANQNAYNAANTNYLNFNNQQLNAGQQLAGLGAQQQQHDLTGAAALDTSGGQQQNLNQQNLNMAYQDFQNQAQWPQQQTQFMLNSLNGVQPGTTSQANGTKQVTNTGMSPLTALTTGYGAYQTFNGGGGGYGYGNPAATAAAGTTPNFGGDNNVVGSTPDYLSQIDNTAGPVFKRGGYVDSIKVKRVPQRAANYSDYNDYRDAA